MIQAVNTPNHQLEPYNITKIISPLQVLCHMYYKVLDKDTGGLLEYQHLIRQPNSRETWGKLYCNELGKLEKVIPVRVDGTNIILFIQKQDVQSDQFKDVTDGNIICDYK